MYLKRPEKCLFFANVKIKNNGCKNKIGLFEKKKTKIKTFMKPTIFNLVVSSIP